LSRGILRRRIKYLLWAAYGRYYMSSEALEISQVAAMRSSYRARHAMWL
jgi:hypothetical protein